MYALHLQFNSHTQLVNLDPHLMCKRKSEVLGGITESQMSDMIGRQDKESFLKRFWTFATLAFILFHQWKKRKLPLMEVSLYSLTKVS